MPVYTFQNPEGQHFTKRLSFVKYEQVRAGDLKLVDENDTELALVFDPGDGLGFVLKDGESGGWASKSMKENRIRQARGHEMARREKDHVFKSRLVPNYQGQEAHSWDDVRDHVHTTKGAVYAKTYDRLVKQEKKSP